MDLLERHRIEQQFFDAEAVTELQGDLRMDDVVPRYRNPSPEPRTPKEYMFHQMLPLEGRRVLDYGCGNGENSVLLAKCGAMVEAFDLSSAMCRVAVERARVNDVAARVNVSCRSGEQTGYPDETFDVVFGFAILHHLDMEMACREIRRVLKPDGIAIFAEPVAFSRSFRLVKRGVRQVLGPPTHVTETERQLTQQDFVVLRKHFGRVEYTPFGFFTRFLRLRWLKGFEPRSLAIDYHLLRAIPPLGRYCSYVTLSAREPRAVA